MSDLSANDSAEATAVLLTFMEAGARHDAAAMRACVTRRTRESDQMNAQGGPPEEMRFILDEQHMEGEQMVIHARAFPVGAPDGTPPAMEMPCFMVKEDGQWKFDLMGSVERMMGGSMDKVVEQVATAMGEAMKGVGEALADGLQQAFGQDATAAALPADQDWSNAPLTPNSKELLPLPELKDLPKTQAAIQEALGSPVLVMAAMKELLEGAGSDEPDVLFNWFEGQLFAGWAAMLAQVAQTVPLKDRLRAIRIEAASSWGHRLLAIDGSDLVYRMMLPDREGFFQDDQAAAMLPGVLMGLPEAIEDTAVGYRLLPLDEQKVDLELYRQCVAPRYMRRISELLGRHVALDANWSELGDCADAGRALTMWGLNRIYGGIAYACLDPSRREELAKGLSSIRLVMTSEESTGYARHKDGLLELGLRAYRGEGCGCYEHEIAAALTGAAPT